MRARQPRARFADHVGELKLALEADTPEELFIEAARVVSRECGPVQGEPGGWERVEISARDMATLLVDWLNELIGRSEVAQRAYGDVCGLTLQRGETSTDGADAAPATAVTLQAEIRGRPVRRWTSALKAATYHGLRLGQRHRRWQAEVLLDV